MVSSEERLKVLEMIAEGKLDVEDGATLLKTLESDSSRRARPQVHDHRQLRVKVDESAGGRHKVNVVLPIALVNAGINIASNFIDRETEEHTRAVIEAIESGRTGKILDIYDDDGEHVQIFVE